MSTVVIFAQLLSRSRLTWTEEGRAQHEYTPASKVSSFPFLLLRLFFVGSCTWPNITIPLKPCYVYFCRVNRIVWSSEDFMNLFFFSFNQWNLTDPTHRCMHLLAHVSATNQSRWLYPLILRPTWRCTSSSFLSLIQRGWLSFVYLCQILCLFPWNINSSNTREVSVDNNTHLDGMPPLLCLDGAPNHLWRWATSLSLWLEAGSSWTWSTGQC